MVEAITLRKMQISNKILAFIPGQKRVKFYKILQKIEIEGY